jgi:hypothetical protein
MKEFSPVIITSFGSTGGIVVSWSGVWGLMKIRAKRARGKGQARSAVGST